MSEKITGESREDALERILAETAKNPYAPKRPLRPNRPSGPAKPVVKTIPSPENRSETVSFSEKTGVERTVGRSHVSDNTAQVRHEVKRPEAQSDTAQPVRQVSAAEKIAAIKRARELRENNEQLQATNEIKKNMPQQQFQEDYADSDIAENDYFDDAYDFSCEKNNSNEIVEYILGLIEQSLTIVFCVLLFYTYIINVAEVDGPSMEPTLYDNDKLLVRSIMYTPESGDVVIINNDNANLISESGKVVETSGLEKRIVKRVIAVGGQTVDIDFETGEVTVDGKVLSEKYISETTTRDEYAFEYPLTIPDGYVFVMGDNRNLSMDSRHPKIGLVSEDDIIGEAFMRVYPFSEFGLIE